VGPLSVAPPAAPGPAGAGSIRAFLDRLRLLLWSARLAAALARAAAVAAIAVVLNTLVAERAGAPPWAGFALALTGQLALAAALARGVAELRFPSRESAARRVEALVPDLRNDVASSLELAPLLDAPDGGPVSRPLVGALVDGTRARLARLEPRRHVPLRGLATGLALLGAAAAPLALCALTGPGIPGPAVRALLDPRVYWPLGRIVLAVEPGDARIARGTDLVVRVRATGGRPAAVALASEDGAGGGASVEMGRAPDGAWLGRFDAVVGPLRYRAVAAGSASPWYRVEVADAPAAGSFEVLYTYPAYCGLGARRVQTGGGLEALRGTTAEISFATTVPLGRGVLVSGASRTAVEPAGEGRYRAALYLDGARSWRLELQDAGGVGNGGGPEYPVRYLPDAPPTAELLEPTGTIESDPRAAVLLRYRAADDYGLSRLALVARSAAGERRFALPLPAGARAAGGEYEWDLGAVAPQPGETVTAVIEATDNDTIGGPKVGASAPLQVRIADPRQKREEVRETMRKLSDELVGLLGEELDLQGRYGELEKAAEGWPEYPWGKAEEAAARERAAREAAARAEELTDRVAAALERSPDAAEETLLQAQMLRRGLEQLRERRLEPMAEVAAGLKPGEAGQEDARGKAGYLSRTAAAAAEDAEQLALMAETMQREGGMASVERGARAMAEAEDRLLAALQRLAPGDRAAAEEVLKSLGEIERELRDIAEALARENKELPEEFLNSDALKNMDLGELLGDIERVREMLRAGDIAGATRAAKALAEKLADLRSRLRRAGEEFDEKFDRALQRLRTSGVPELQKLVEEEQALLGRTEAVEGAVGPRLDQELRRMAAARDTSPPPGEAGLLTPQERERTRALGQEQEGLRGRAGRLLAEIAAIKAALPFLPAEVAASLDRAGGHMGEAGGKLGGGLPGQALQPERSAVAELVQARDAAAQALDDMAQMQSMRQGPGSPSGMGQRPGSMPGGQPRSDRGLSRRSGGRRGTDVRNFLIPGKQDFRAPRLFREEILKSLREGYPAQYEERIRDYYQRITE
jgi:hypothetical protein